MKHPEDADKVLAVLAEQIKELRDARGWTQEQLALEAGTQPATVSRYESMQAGRNSFSFLSRLAGGFGMKLVVRFEE